MVNLSKQVVLAKLLKALDDWFGDSSDEGRTEEVEGMMKAVARRLKSNCGHCVERMAYELHGVQTVPSRYPETRGLLLDYEDNEMCEIQCDGCKGFYSHWKLHKM